MDAPYKLDPMQQLVWDSEISVACLGRNDGEHVLIPLPFDAHAQAVTLQIATERGYSYCGAFGFRAGDCSSVVEPTNPDALPIMLQAAFTFARQIAALLKPTAAAPDDSAEWLANLFKLEDPRKDN